MSGGATRVRLLLRALIALVALEVAAAGLDATCPPDLAKARRASPVALDRNGAWLRALPVENGRWRLRADLARTDPSFVQRLIAVEDARFWLHAGVDPAAVLRAALGDLARGRIASGASTLTLQAARRLEPRPRTFGAKLIEAARALQLEARFSKPEILALYLSLAPYGGNLEGVRAASLAWFGHEPLSLTDGEQALLIALPQAPEARRPDRRPRRAAAARARVLARLVRAGLMSEARAAEAALEPLPVRRQPFPGVAWQAAGELARAAPAGQATVVSTLDAELQRRLAPLALAAARRQGPDTAVAVLVVEARSRAVRAAIAGQGLDGPAGWLDLTRALRSPGSALKPFIYAMAFDEGLAAPDTRLADAPTRFEGYAPENFDRLFHDQVSAREALAYSLNVPAVAMLQKLGASAFEARLRGVGVRLARPRARLADPGLALALGGYGISPRDVALLYAGLADGGEVKPLAWTEADAARRPDQPGLRLVRPEAAAQVVDILRESPPPPGRAPTQLTAEGPRLAFKTGTSYGFRDAWAAGIGAGYVVVVWSGRPDGGARAAGTGREAAAPLLFDVFDALGGPAGAPRALGPGVAPAALQALTPPTSDGCPGLIFPPDGAAVSVEGFGPAARGLQLTARGEGLRWFVDGAPLKSPAQGDPIWRPSAPGFYRLSVESAAGCRVSAKVRVRSN